MDQRISKLYTVVYSNMVQIAQLQSKSMEISGSENIQAVHCRVFQYGTDCPVTESNRGDQWIREYPSCTLSCIPIWYRLPSYRVKSRRSVDQRISKLYTVVYSNMVQIAQLQSKIMEISGSENIQAVHCRIFQYGTDCPVTE